MRIPLENSTSVAVGGLQFYQWMPGQSEAIQLVMGSFKVALWPERPGWQKDEDIAKTLNVTSKHLICEVTTQVDANIAQQLSEAPGRRALASPELEAFAGTVRETVLLSVNRLLSHLRAAKGNFWLPRLDEQTGLLASLFLQFAATVSVDDEAPIQFRPSSTDSSSGAATGLDRVIRREDWRRAAQATADENRRPSLVGELLAAADEHRAAGRQRVALTEAVSALQVALGLFANRVESEGASIVGVPVRSLKKPFRESRTEKDFAIPVAAGPPRRAVTALDTRNCDQSRRRARCSRSSWPASC